MTVLFRSLSAAIVVAILVSPAQAAQAPLPSELQASPASEQVKPSAQAQESSPYTLKVDATLVNVDVLVTDEDGRVLTGLKQGNFRILDNGVPQQILSFSPTSAPITIVMLLEFSSASYSYYAGKAADWGSAFLDHLEPTDWVALVTFDLKPTVQVDFTHKRFEVRDKLGMLGMPQFSDTNLFDALMDTLDKLDGVRARKAILLMATGANSFSSSTLYDVYERLKQTDTTIFCIGLAEGEYVRYGNSDISYMMGKNWLSSFAKRTGGFALFPRFEGELPGIFRSVVGVLRSEYTLTFRPPRESRDGRYHRLKVEVVGPDGKPLKVTDDKSRSRKVEVLAREGYRIPKDEAP